MLKKAYAFAIFIAILVMVSCTQDADPISSTPPDREVPPEETDREAEVFMAWVDLSFVGDVMMDDAIGDYIKSYGADYPWTDVAPWLKKAHIAVANLETSVSTRGATTKPEGFGFRSHPDTLSGLENSGIAMVSLANNHTLDFGPGALADTINSLNEYGIAHAGAGANIREAVRPAILNRNGLAVGFLSYTSIIPCISWIATDSTPGIAPLRPEYYEQIYRQVREARQQCDILVILLHWGLEYSNQVEPWQRELAWKLIDNGADAIVGHHPHVLRGIEFYRNRPILYSTGNFIFLKRDDEAGHTAIFNMRLNVNGFVSGYIQPVNILYARANLLDPDSGLFKKIMEDMQQLSKPLGTTFTGNGQFYPTIN